MGELHLVSLAAQLVHIAASRAVGDRKAALELCRVGEPPPVCKQRQRCHCHSHGGAICAHHTAGRAAVLIHVVAHLAHAITFRPRATPIRCALSQRAAHAHCCASNAKLSDLARLTAEGVCRVVARPCKTRALVSEKKCMICWLDVCGTHRRPCTRCHPRTAGKCQIHILHSQPSWPHLAGTFPLHMGCTRH